MDDKIILEKENEFLKSQIGLLKERIRSLEKSGDDVLEILAVQCKGVDQIKEFSRNQWKEIHERCKRLEEEIEGVREENARLRRELGMVTEERDYVIRQRDEALKADAIKFVMIKKLKEERS